MTAVETIEYAQGSVDQLQRGLEFVQENLGRADAFAVKADDFVETAGEIVIRARRISRMLVLAGGLAVVGGVVAVVLIKRLKKARVEAEPETSAA